jgi:hypothetical protein
MIAAANTTIDADTSGDDVQGALPDNAIPRDCDPNRHLDWRYRYAVHLVQNSSQHPITHEDPWVQANIDYCLACDSNWEDRNPTIVDVAIGTALELWKGDSLAKHLLEARLLAQEQPQAIYGQCHLSLGTICSYLMLMFDVRGRDRKGIWFLHPSSAGKIAGSKVWHFGFALKQYACRQTTEDIEDHIEVLCRLDGPTMADGLPARTEPAFGQELLIRQTLAEPLLSDTRPVKKLMDRFQEAAIRDLQHGRSSSESFDLGVEILQKAKIPAALRKEIQRERELCSQAAEVTAAAAEKGIAVESLCSMTTDSHNRIQE